MHTHELPSRSSQAEKPIETESSNKKLIEEITHRLKLVGSEWNRLYDLGVMNGVYESMPDYIRDLTELISDLPAELKEIEANTISVLLALAFPMPPIEPVEVKNMPAFIDFDKLMAVLTFLELKKN